ncbi:MAG: Holliday junction resolvase RecU [Erysipelotrichaceae bacterium]|nr:Holliday junction resolvase RecU [Erysipelotrichaceae bacterium]
MIGYPNKKSIPVSHQVRDNYMGRGMSLEDDLNKSNEYYLEIERAVIHKKPIPVQIVRVDYPQRSAAKIVEAYYKTPSTTDYNGIYRGKAIDFEAKETKSKTSFPLSNIHPHQIKHLMRVLKHGGIGFVIIRFCAYDETYLVDAQYMIQRYQQNESKSIPYAELKDNGFLIKRGFTPRLHYLDVVDQCYFKEEA